MPWGQISPEAAEGGGCRATSLPFAYMVKKMAGLREGDGTLLDHCIMMWGSGFEDGNTHTHRNLPFILAGRGGRSLKTGRFLTGIEGNQWASRSTAPWASPRSGSRK